jgi:hypothetical protein
LKEETTMKNERTPITPRALADVLPALTSPGVSHMEVSCTVSPLLGGPAETLYRFTAEGRALVSMLWAAFGALQGLRCSVQFIESAEHNELAELQVSQEFDGASEWEDLNKPAALVLLHGRAGFFEVSLLSVPSARGLTSTSLAELLCSVLEEGLPCERIAA